MFRSRKSRAREAQQVAEQAWEQMVGALGSAGGAARSAGRRTQGYADEAQHKVSAAAGKAGAAADEARRRASAAVDALAGRRPRMHWEFIAGAAVAGLVLGWLAAASARRAVESMETREVGSPVARLQDSSVSPEF